ncbi:leucyl aminopeptidase family protein [Lentzea tibetensis]|uniref:Probable cytosol aminopeptidase n=1 Tax=Lentzea tibetensis TaxID=2591470 RepID=A0A563ER08_9PSEU|nr:leucyl aminopeptidase family protein [Lentzea tibetensis]TWP49261.1 leucyl aminopeptidase family protein [Lentzea tibetensis]
MRTPVPTVPTKLVDVEVASAPRDGVTRVVLAATGPELGPGAQSADLTGVTGKAGETVRQADPDLWVLGIGAGTIGDWKIAGASLVRALTGDTAPKTADVLLTDIDADALRAFVLGAALGGYRFRVTGEDAKPQVRTLRLVVADQGIEDVLAASALKAHALATATALTRDLANTPSNVKDPKWLASTGAKLAEKVTGVTAVVRDEKWLAEQGFGGVLAVGGGSSRPPRFLELSWNASAKNVPHVVLVGKGITFDTGGISVKPADGMHLMRTDMAGGAAVISALMAIARRGLPVRVTTLVPCAENHVSGTAYRPGDVVRHYGGATTEVVNTDAEGRMVLADAMAYAVTKLSPDLLVDVATLTGAMKVTLGLRTGGLFTNTDSLATDVIAAGERAGERWWRMPLLEEHADAVHSEIADYRQCPPGPGGITAALFLEKFAGGLPWVHLDIAGPARSEKNYDEVVPGATGFGARTLVELVEDYARKA